MRKKKNLLEFLPNNGEKKSLQTKLAILFLGLFWSSGSSLTHGGRAIYAWEFYGGKRFAIVRDGRGYMLGSWWALSFHFDKDGELIDWMFWRNRRNSEDRLIVGRGERFRFQTDSFFPIFKGGLID